MTRPLLIIKLFKNYTRFKNNFRYKLLVILLMNLSLMIKFNSGSKTKEKKAFKNKNRENYCFQS